jgi:hypothetical protein
VIVRLAEHRAVSSGFASSADCRQEISSVMLPAAGADQAHVGSVASGDRTSTLRRDLDVGGVVGGYLRDHVRLVGGDDRAAAVVVLGPEA